MGFEEESVDFAPILGDRGRQSSGNKAVSTPVSCHSAQEGNAKGVVWLRPVWWDVRISSLL